MKPIPSLSFEIHPQICVFIESVHLGAPIKGGNQDVNRGWRSFVQMFTAIRIGKMIIIQSAMRFYVVLSGMQGMEFQSLTPPSRKKAFSLVFRAAPCLSFVGAGQMSRSAAEGQQAAKNPSLLVLPTGKPTWLWKITMFWIYIKYQRLISVAMFNYQKNPEDIALGVWFGAMSGSYQEEYHHGASKNRNHTRSADPLTIGWTWGLPPHYLGVPEIDQKLITA